MSIVYDNFKLNSDFETDDVILCSEISLSLSNNLWFGKVTHNFGFKPLPFAMVELNGSGIWLNASETTSTDVLSLTVLSTTIDIQVGLKVPSGTTANSVKARIFAMLPSDQNVSTPAPSTFSTFTLNSENKYDELLLKGTANVTNQSGSSQLICTHNLGYIPRVMMWQEQVGGTTLVPLAPAYSAQSQSGLPTTVEVRAVQLTTTTIEMWYYNTQGSLPNLKLHYRIYASKLQEE